MQTNHFRLKYLFNFIQQHNSPLAEKCLAEIGLSKTDLQPDRGTNSTQKEAKFLKLAFDTLGDPTIGAQAGLAYHKAPTLPGYIARHSKDIAAAIINSARYYSTADKGYSYSLRLSGNSSSFELETLDESLTKYYRHKEFMLYSALGYLRSITQNKFFPLEMRFGHEQRSDVKKFGHLAGCSVKFGCEKTEMILSNSTLKVAIPTYDLSLRKHLTEYGERLLKDIPSRQPSLSVRVEGILVKGLPDQLVPSDEVAASLGLSSRTMARRLSDENTTFRVIVDDLRFDLAKSYLGDGINITEVAYLLAYADSAAFSSAFKRWAGMSPSVYQRTNLASRA